mmetsp:Transcript_19697/g.51266  ORF Transcript_19697/g.51266 Transcript_19697/m.51266 type:complete len:465 (+) Transcript_19697:159-1553(+)|eukprot:CAMPEP_0182922770 /NCGR_PEP_ID=MMETSP0105_2-20130417/5011_1 /TAXON_ID=81532 ORGANISM="Acanthoeca-like sp., Strain 10tr" /NCGR_SAMPLE_ID=MMETSP0105_2 /ASSEMBLY_ACC=CAM_ASM_000205 /LENGTH=464 /DNA_ID=CAMNT_0025060421 /DNA_START=126 /DNA_END=1520 /DNA_ORIENTATION=+
MSKTVTTTITTIHPDGHVETTTTTETVSENAAAGLAEAAPAPAATAFPDTIAAVSADFLSRVLGAIVKSFETTVIGIGFVCDAYKVTITAYDGPAGPPSCVLKMPKDDAASREVNQGCFAMEAHWYRAVAAHVPIESATCFGVFTDETDPTRFLLVLEDLTLDPDAKGYPGWMVGCEEEVMQATIDDLAKMHGKFFNSPELDKLVPPTPLPPGMKEGSYCSPFVITGLAAFMPWPAADLLGFPPDTPAITIFEALLSKMKDYLQWEYDHKGETYRLPDGPLPYPDPRFKPPNGVPLMYKACEILGSRKGKTLCHGDGHPGNLFRNTRTGAIKWLDFQGYAVGPPGFDLAQGLSLGVLGASKDKLRGMVEAYYAKLLEYGPPSVQDVYPLETCWEDFLIAMVVWYPAYIVVHTLSLPTIKGSPEELVRLGGYKLIVPRYLALVEDLNFLDGTVNGLLKKIAEDAA